MSVDCPFPFRHNDRFYMLYVGFDGKGYQTGLAVSDDLLHWQSLGPILKRDESGRWNSVGMAANCILMDSYDLFAQPKPKKIDGKYWMVYHSYPNEGYENGSAAQGIAYTEDENLLNWHFLEQPVFLNDESFAWERGGLYKSCIVEHANTYYMFYNAKDDDPQWTEQIGMAVSEDLLHWKRYENNPVLSVGKNTWDARFASDPAVWYDSVQKQWVMFYYGYNGIAAMDGIAVSNDLVHWEKYPEAIVKPGEKGSLDCVHAHKPGVIFHGGELYHFYCACRPFREGDAAKFGGEFRCITVAKSRPWE